MNLILKYKLFIISLLFFIKITNGLYEDQIKKFDWLQLNIGKLTAAIFDPIPSNNRIIVTTEDNVLAAISSHNGEIQWRQIFEKSPRGDIKLFQFVNEDNAVQSSRLNPNVAYDIITVSGQAPAMIRGWSAGSGNLEWEWSIMPLQSDKSNSAVWFHRNNDLYHIIPYWGSHLELTKYHAATGQSSERSTKITAPWIQENQCILAQPYYVCASNKQLIYMDLLADQPQIQRLTLEDKIQEKLKIVKGREATVIVNKKIIDLTKSKSICPQIELDSGVQYQFDKKSVFVHSQLKQNILKIQLASAETCDNVGITLALNYPEYYGSPDIYEFTCKTKRNGDKICFTLLSTKDGAILYLQQDKIRWTREESLSKIVATELIDLPLSDSEGAIESELNSKAGDIVGAFFRRIFSQILLMKSVFLHIIGLGLPPTSTQKAGLIRDSFGLHKILVVLTESGKLYGIDNLSRKIHWQQYLSDMVNFNDDENMKLLVQRTSKHFPLDPLCVVIGKSRRNQHGLIYQFNPITGLKSETGLLELNYKIKQLALLNENENEFVRGLVLLDENNQGHVIPESSKHMANGMYFYIADKKKTSLIGYYIQERNEILDTLQIWNVSLTGSSGNHRILKIKAKNPIESVHSQGRVLADRSVLYKYINPNLVAVLTEGLDNIHKYVMNIYLIDVVSGSIVFSMNHKKVREPVHIVHSENWLVYSYYNDKARRTEITSVELYEGKVQANSTVWSSLDAPPMPLIERQSYIIPSLVEAMKETVTERGITSKHILIATPNGGIMEMPWSFLDPRRPVSANQMREEGLHPYIPELIMPAENFINYNQTIGRIREIYTAPSGLESTCLVVAYGLDLYVTRVSPSRTFDLLKEDFDYFLIIIVLVGLTSGSFFVKYLSVRKAIKQAWK